MYNSTELIDSDISFIMMIMMGDRVCFDGNGQESVSVSPGMGAIAIELSMI
jgi:hypothetical protein